MANTTAAQRNWNERQNTCRYAVNYFREKLGAGMTEEAYAEYFGLDRTQYDAWIQHSADLSQPHLDAVWEKLEELDAAEQAEVADVKMLAEKAQYYDQGNTLRDAFRTGEMKFLKRS